MFSYRHFSLLSGLPAASLDISSFRWRLARADVGTSTCQKGYERLWLSFISDLKYFGETRYRISYHKIICTIQLLQNFHKTGNLPFRRSISRVISRLLTCNIMFAYLSSKMLFRYRQSRCEECSKKRKQNWNRFQRYQCGRTLKYFEESGDFSEHIVENFDRGNRLHS